MACLSPVAVEYDDFTVDIAENQLLLLAAKRLVTVSRINEQARRRLQRLRLVLADVTAPPRGAVLPTWRRTRLNARYHSALALAQIVLAAESFEHRIGHLRVTGYMFDMWRVFEDFVTTALQEALRSFGRYSVSQAALCLDVAERVDVRPDLLWYCGGVTSGGRRQVQSRTARRLPQRGPLPNAGLLHGTSPTGGSSGVCEGERTREPTHRTS